MTRVMAFTAPASTLQKLRYVLLTSLLGTLAACSSGSSSDDTIRIGSGQTGNTGTTSSADFPIFYVKRVTPDFTDPDTDDDLRRLRLFSTNADLYMRDRASPSALERSITARAHPANERWDVKDVDVSADGSKVIFAMRGPLDDTQEDKDPPTWNIWEYTIGSDTLQRVISSNVIAEEGQDVSPHYLPDGHILFASTRQYQSKAVLLDENKQQFEAQDENRDESSFVLHVMDSNGANIQQVSFNQSHDMDPTVLSDGRILFSRWDHASGRNGVHFYTANPDGTNTQLLYGSASHTTIADTDTSGTITYPAVQFTKAREMRDGRILTLIRPFSGTEYGGDLYMIDTGTYVENNQAAVAGNSAAGPAAGKVTPGNVRMLSVPSIGGRFVSAAPLWDGTGRLLVSWTQCRVIDPTTSAVVNCTSARLADPTFVSAPPVYSVWMFNPADGTQQPVVPPEEGVMVSDVVVAQSRTPPTFLPVSLNGNLAINQTLKGEGVGILDIRSVYDFDGSAAATGIGCSITTNADPANSCYTNRPARFLRIEKAVSLPDRDVYDFDNNAFGATNFMREILGYIPVEPDGSVRVKVPGNVAFQISVTDSEGRRVTAFPRHNAWLTLRPGETVQCSGCHANSTNLPAGQSGRSHGRNGAFVSAYTGAVGSNFSNANGSFVTVSGQTMAQARAAWSCSNEQCAAITPGVNVAFADVWPLGADPKVAPTLARSGDFALRYAGTGGLTTKIPTSSTCLTVWSNICRITINYLEHVQPLWERPLGFDANNDMAVDNKDNCLACHSRTDAANATRVPAGQLDLTTDASDDNNLRVMSYQELLFGDNALELNGNVLQDHCIQFVTDPVTMVQTCAQFETVSPSLIARNARGSRFFSRFTSAGTHATAGVPWLTAGELRLISEWVDIGAQYYNDPFKAPEN
jgi:Hydrazine synthase alpha subunit middle domain